MSIRVQLSEEERIINALSDRIGASLRYWWARFMITRLMLWLCPPRRKPVRTVKSGDWGDPAVWEDTTTRDTGRGR
jgi:hypothetical protein